MPIIITPGGNPDQPELSELHGTLPIKADTQSRRLLRGQLLLRSSSLTQVLVGTLQVKARTAAQALSGRLHLLANSHPTQSGGSIIHYGSRPLQLDMQGSNGLRVLSFDFSHTAQGRELNLVLAGAVPVARDTPLSLTIVSSTGRTLTLGPVLADGEYSIERLPDQAARTTVRGADREILLLGNTRLEELIPWANNPSREVALPGLRSITRQVRTVRSVLTDAFDAANQTLELRGEVLSRWEETRREYTTLGKTPLQVFQETYGLLNYELVRVGENSWVSLPPAAQLGIIDVNRRYLLPGNESRQVLQYPANVRVQGGDRFIDRTGYLEQVAITGELPDQATGPDGKKVKVEIRDPQTARIEVAESATLAGVTVENGRTTRYAVVKQGGRVVRSIELVTGDVDVTQEIDVVVDGSVTVVNGSTTSVQFAGPQVRTLTRTHFGVVLSLSETTHTYLSPTSKTETETQTVRRRYAYSYNQVLTAVALPDVLGQGGTAPAGTLLGQEGSTEQFVWSHQGGHLRQRTLTETRITALGQEQADDSQTTNPPLALELNRTVTVETWTPTGDGLWLHVTTRGQAAKLPVLDLTGGDWVKQISVPMTMRSAEKTETAPPSVSDPEIPAPQAQGQGTAADSPPVSGLPIPPPFEYLRDPAVETVRLDGDADAASIELPMVEDYQGDLLKSLGAIWAKELKPRTTRQLRTLYPESLRPRFSAVGFGLIRSVRASGGAGSFLMEATCEDRDP